MSFTTTYTYTRLTPADPYKLCAECGQHVCFWPEYPPQAEEHPLVNMPCGHDAGGYISACPSWGPVDGCRCQEFLGAVLHGPASSCPEHGPA